MTEYIENIAETLNVDSNTMVSTLTAILIFGLGLIQYRQIKRINNV